LVGKLNPGFPIPRYGDVIDSLVDNGIFGLYLSHILCRNFPFVVDGSILVADLKHVRVRDFVVLLFPRCKNPFVVGVENIVLQFLAAKTVLDMDMEANG
jgi:hypothetical protein